MKVVRLILFLLLILFGSRLLLPVSASEGCEDKAGEPPLYTCLGSQIGELTHLLELSRAATSPLEAEVGSLKKRTALIQAQINAAVKRQAELEREIKEREKSQVEQYVVLLSKLREHYKSVRANTKLALILSEAGSGESSRELVYREVAAEKDRGIILALSNEVIKLVQDKADVKKSQLSLASLQAQLDKQKDFFEGEIAGAKAYQADLANKIAVLSTKQQEVLSEKSGTFQTTVGDVPLSDDSASSPDYNPGFSPAFAAFSFGAPHYKGMSQYGAYGRAKSGQGTEDILRAYYGDVRIETVDTNGSINTTVGALPFEDNYMRGIAEMPSKWANDGGMAALEAQAIAARSYALSYVGWRMGKRSLSGNICVTQACQVYHSSKVGDGTWGTAVANTRGKILVSNKTGEIISTWYASTSGGYQESYTTLGHTTPAFWDTKNGRDGWTSEAYEKIAGSPWFYKGWYKSRSGDSCGRSHPWLSGEEMADILNAWVVLVKNGQSDERVVASGPCWGGNPYSINELYNKANSLGGGYLSVNSVSVVYANNGVTAEVRFETNRGSVVIKGSEFKKAFNLRAPGRIALKSGLFNIERK